MLFPKLILKLPGKKIGTVSWVVMTYFFLFLHYNLYVFNFNVLITQNVVKIDTVEAV